MIIDLSRKLIQDFWRILSPPLSLSTWLSVQVAANSPPQEFLTFCRWPKVVRQSGGRIQPRSGLGGDWQYWTPTGRRILACNIYIFYSILFYNLLFSAIFCQFLLLIVSKPEKWILKCSKVKYLQIYLV